MAPPQPGQMLVTGHGARSLDIGAADTSELSLCASHMLSVS